jgi:hypothetical protein
MRHLVAITSLTCGILFILVPRYILPACEFAGFARMHCSDTAQAEAIVGVLLVLAAGMTLMIRSTWMPLAGGVLSLLLLGITVWLPETYGYCLSPKMPCKYGMVPAIRFISVTGSLIMIGALFTMVRSYRKKGRS